MAEEPISEDIVSSPFGTTAQSSDAVFPGAGASYRLLETGDFRLLEDGDFRLLED